MRVVRILAAALGGGVLLLPGAAAAAPTPHYVGIVIGGQYACVRWHAGITGDEVLNQAAQVTYRSDGIVLTINRQPDPPDADDSHFWSYWHDTGSRWQYSSLGASAYQPAAGTVEGWAFDHGHATAPTPASNPRGLYATICGARDQSAPSSTATHTEPATHSVTHSATHTAHPTRAHTVAPSKTTTHVAVTPSTPVAPSLSAAAHTRATVSPSRRPRQTSEGATNSAANRATVVFSAVPSARPAAQSLRPLPEPKTASADGGSPVPLIIGAAAVLMIGAGGAWAGLRRRRAD